MAAVLGFAFMTSSAVGGGGTAPKAEWGLPASMAVVYLLDGVFACQP